MMQLYILISLILLTPLIIICGLLTYWYIKQYKYRGLKDIPGPKPLPIIGNALLFKHLTPPTILRTLANLQNQYGRIYKIWIGFDCTISTNKPEYLEQLLGTNENNSKSDIYRFFLPWIGDGLLTSGGSKWKSRRKIITPTFHFKVLENFMEVFNRQSDIMINKIMEAIKEHPNESIDVSNYVNLLALDNICETAFGVSVDVQQNKNRSYVKAVEVCNKVVIFRSFSPWLASDLLFYFSKYYRPFYDAVKVSHNLTDAIIKRRTELAKFGKIQKVDNDGIRVKKAFLDVLLDANQHSEVLSDSDLRDEVNTFLFEGHDTTSATMASSLYALAGNPDIQEKLYKELSEYFGNDVTVPITISDLNNLKYLDNVFKEALRMYSPVPRIERCLDKEWTVDGMKIPKGTRIAIDLFSMGYDPEIFPNPDKFDPDRFLLENQIGRHNYAYVPFSAGSRNCVGQKHATNSAKTAITKFILNYKIEADPSHTPNFGSASTLKSVNGVKLKVFPRICNR